MGEMRCPHCRSIVDWQWGHADLNFTPQKGGAFASVILRVVEYMDPPEDP
jgi:hypothetical protein